MYNMHGPLFILKIYIFNKLRCSRVYGWCELLTLEQYFIAFVYVINFIHFFNNNKKYY